MQIDTNNDQPTAPMKSCVFNKQIIESGDVVILVHGNSNMHQIRVEPNGSSQFFFGAIKHKDLIGKPYGSQIKCSKPGVSVYALNLFPELWTLALPHRTQIIYTPDCALIQMQLELQPGKIVFEAGTGSGSLTHSLCRAVLPRGHVYTFDFHEERVQRARAEFEQHQLADYVTCTHCDVVAHGFSLVDAAASASSGSHALPRPDAIILDLPNPWKVVQHVRRMLSRRRSCHIAADEAVTTTRIAFFCPCIEQVTKVTQELRRKSVTKDDHDEQQADSNRNSKQGEKEEEDEDVALEWGGTFSEIEVMENLQRKYIIRRNVVPQPDVGGEIENCNFQYESDENEQKKAEKKNEDEDSDGKEMRSCGDASESKRPRLADDAVQKQVASNHARKGGRKSQKTSVTLQSEFDAVPPAKMPGHTGFLIFATWCDWRPFSKLTCTLSSTSSAL